MNIIIPIGISGSGKSRLYNLRYKKLELVSPDLIRKELTGDISNQSRNREVFDEVDRRVIDLVKKNKSFFYDATNLNTEFRKKFVNMFSTDKNVKITYIILPADVEKSRERIEKDLTEGKDRSKVPYEALIKQKKMYDQTLRTRFDGENVHEVIWMR